MFISKKEYESYQELYKKYQNCVARLIDMETELEETRQKYQDLKRKTESIKTYSATIETSTGEVFIYKGIKALSYEEAKDKAYQKVNLSSYRTYWISIKLED